MVSLLVLPILIGVKWELILVKFWIFPVNDEGEHLFMSLLATHIFYFVRCQLECFCASK